MGSRQHGNRTAWDPDRVTPQGGRERGREGVGKMGKGWGYSTGSKVWGGSEGRRDGGEGRGAYIRL